MMEMYRSEKVNPLSGCLPILIQIPFFIALYYMIIESVELRQAPFMLWIHDLSVADPFFILPVIMGGLMFVQQKLNPPAPDPMQQKVMMFLPVIFTIFFLTFPAGLVLYWITNTALSILQQWWVMKRVEKMETEHKGHHKKF
jgi:YidC/Oxa1 family membrane protein insertase